MINIIIHINNNIFPNEKLSDEHKKRVGYFVKHKSIWWLVNENMPELSLADDKSAIPIGSKVELKDGLKLLLSKQDGGRLAVIQMVN